MVGKAKVREATIYVGALNVAMHGRHTAQRYVDLFSSVFHSKKIVPTRSEQGALLGSLYYRDANNPLSGIRGEVYRFIKLDPAEPWFNLQNNEAADPAELEQIRIPAHLKPHLVHFGFTFFPKGHRLYFETRNGTKTFGPSTAKQVFYDLLNGTSEFGIVEVTAEPEKDAVDEVLGIPNLHRLCMDLVRPNPDDHAEEERRILERLANQNARKMEVSLVAPRNLALVPDHETKVLARVAASNGYVQGSGSDDLGRPITRSTREMPWVSRFTFNPDVQTKTEALTDIAAQMHVSLMEA